jgi:NADH-quinone oxidoreductase subunit K
VNVPTEHMLFLAAGLFAIGVLGFIVRRNVIVVLMSVELMLNATILTFLAASRLHSAPGAPDLQGPVFSIFVIAVAAAEAAIGLALIIALYRLKQSVDTDALEEMKG